MGTAFATLTDIENIYPLSSAQEGILFHSLLDPESPVYVSQIYWQLDGSLDVPAFLRVWETLVQRHAILRTAFVWEGLDKPLQVVKRSSEVPLTLQDWRGSGVKPSARLAQFLEADRTRGFALSSSPLFRIALLTTSDTSHYFVWTQHHILLDGWSVLLLLQEMIAEYEAHRARVEQMLSPVTPFSEYIAWISAQDLDESEHFWRERLAGAVPTLIQQHTRDDGAARIRKEQAIRLPEALVRAAAATARKLGLTLNTLAQGSWAIALSRYFGQREVMFGSTVSGRTAPLPGIERMIGLFINTLPVRVDVDPGRSAAAWLSDLQRQEAQARRYEHVPLIAIQKSAGLIGQESLFDILISFQNLHIDLHSPADSARVDETSEASLRAVDSGAFENPHYALSVTVGTGDQMSLVATYDAARLDDHIVSSLLSQFQLVLEGIAERPQTVVGDLPTLSNVARCEVLAASRGETKNYSTACLHELAEAQALKTPDAIALVFESTHLTYSEFDRRAGALAHQLTASDIGPEHLVGVCLERSLHMVIALAGILKAGAAYLPLDPEHPAERVAYMIRTAAVASVVTLRRFSGHLPVDCQAIFLDAMDSDGVPPISSARRATGDGLAYVLYTSGSTGQPKGAMNTHSAVVNRILWMQDAFALNGSDRVLQKTPFTFDVSGWEFFWPLATGAALVMLPPGAHRDPQLIARAIVDEQITTIHFVPSMLRDFLSEAAAKDCTSLRDIVCSGEALEIKVAGAVTSELPLATLYNLYGPTEAAIDVTSYRYCGATATRTVPIGRPIANLETYVLDSRMSLVAPGMPGELYIGGTGLGRGYVKRPELTAERFVPHPFSTARGARLYRTGDLVRWTSEGDLEFIQRVDNQVKIRGQRIELGEIEAALSDQSGVEQSVVLARDSGHGDPQLVAYVVPERGTSLDLKQLRDALQRRLPRYMCPSAIVVLDMLPLNANGKLDRKRLPAADLANGFSETSYEPPRGPIEQILVGIWERVLNRGRIGRTDHFFELGGHSLLATQVMSRVRGAFHIELPLRALFEAPTIAHLSRVVAQTRESEPTPPVTKTERIEDPPLSFAQQRLWLIDQLNPGTAAYNLPFAWRLNGPLDRQALKNSLDEMVRRHEILRTIFLTKEDGTPVQRILHAREAQLEYVDISTLDEAARDEAANQQAHADAHRPFNLAQGPLFRCTLLHAGDTDHILLFTVHHIVSDAWSMTILAREIHTIYAAYAAGREHGLPAPEIQYADYAIWQRARLQGRALETELAYWRRALAEPPDLNLPISPAGSFDRDERGEAIPFEFTQETTNGLKDLARREMATPFIVMLACWQIVLSRYTGQQDIIVGTGIANRNRKELEDVIGFLVNTLALRTLIRPGVSFKQLLAEVRETVLQAYEHQQVPFEKVIEEVAPERSANQTPVVRTMLVFENAPRGNVSDELLAGIRFTPAFPVAPVARHDISLHVWEDRGKISGTAVYRAGVLGRQPAANLVDDLTRVVTAVCFGEAQSDVGEILIGDRDSALRAIEDFASEIGYAQA